MIKTIQTTCPYCGVGCGIVAEADEALHSLSIAGDQSHPANFGRLCSKGSALGETVGFQGRLLQPKVYGQESSWDEALGLVAVTFQNTIAKYGPDAVAFYGSGQLLTEDYYVANKLMKGFIGSGNMDTNSRLCMSSSVAGHKRAFGSDTVPNCYEDYELAELIVLIGSNAAWCHPVSFQRLRAAKEANPAVKIVVIDPRQTASCDIADLHLPLASGSDAWLFNGLLAYLAQTHSSKENTLPPLEKGGRGGFEGQAACLENPPYPPFSKGGCHSLSANFNGDNLYVHKALDNAFIEQHTEGFAAALNAAQDATLEKVAQHCALNAEDIAQFYDWFASHDKVLSLYSQGINQSSSGTDKVNAILNCHLATGKIGKPGSGPFSLTGQPNAMGGREVGGLSHQLAAHMDFSKPEDIDCVARFWGTKTIATRAGLTAVELFDAIYEGKVKAVWIMGTNPVVSLPDADKVKQALARCEFVVVSDCIAQTDTTALAHVLLPATGWSEKDGTVTNSERRISRQRALFKPSGEAKPDWWIITEIARRMGFADAFSYQSPVEIFREHAALSGFENRGQRDFDISAFASISQSDYDALKPMQWPVTAAHPKGRARFFSDGQFFTPSGKAQFFAIEPRPPVNHPDADYPLILNTGRLRDQWHTMTRTALAPKLNQHAPEPFVDIHPVDAERYGLLANGLAQIESAWGVMLARVQSTDRQVQGTVFVPMHWSAHNASQARMGALVNPVIDPVSKQPESKHTPVRIRPYHAAWYGFILSRREMKLTDCAYWVKSNGNAFYRYELAGDTEPEDWRSTVRKHLCAETQSQPEWQEYSDPALGRYRAARIVGGQLDTVIFIARDTMLPERTWLGSLFAKEELAREERMALLTGCPPLGVPDVGRIVCACFNVGEKTIQAAVKEQGLKTPQEVGRCLKAGTNCGSCVPEIKALL